MWLSAGERASAVTRSGAIHPSNAVMWHTVWSRMSSSGLSRMGGQMKLKAIKDFLWGARKIKAGDVFEADEKTASNFIALGWTAAEEDKPKAAKKKK